VYFDERWGALVRALVERVDRGLFAGATPGHDATGALKPTGEYRKLSDVLLWAKSGLPSRCVPVPVQNSMGTVGVSLGCPTGIRKGLVTEGRK
jgi:hypothetical protein